MPGKNIPKDVIHNSNSTEKENLYKAQAAVKLRIAEYIEKDFDALISDIETLEPKEKVKVKLELAKLVMPKSQAEDEPKKEDYPQTEFIKRLFGKMEEK